MLSLLQSLSFFFSLTSPPGELFPPTFSFPFSHTKLISSGLDSQSSWSIVSFLRRLSEHGQAILCTIHQPSAILFQEFDQLLFLARGGKTVYFGPIGKQSRTLLDYFESHGARECDDAENPAEYMIEVVNAGCNPDGENWFDVWKGSEESQRVQVELDRIHKEQQEKVPADQSTEGLSEFAMPFWFQLWQVTYRVFQQYWRMPEYILSKWILGLAAGLFIGFSFYQAKASLQGLQTVIYSVFMICTIFTSLVQQVCPTLPTCAKEKDTNFASRLCPTSLPKDLCMRSESVPARLTLGRPS